jgi:hypothetical protein
LTGRPRSAKLAPQPLRRNGMDASHFEGEVSR